MELEKMTQQQLLLAISGALGTVPISGTAEISVKHHAFEADSNTVISSIKDKDGIERIADIGWNARTILSDKVVFYGFEAHKITLASGSGQVYRTQKPF